MTDVRLLSGEREISNEMSSRQLSDYVKLLTRALDDELDDQPAFWLKLGLMVTLGPRQRPTVALHLTPRPGFELDQELAQWIMAA